MSDRPSLASDLFRMTVKMIVGGFLIILLTTCGVMTVAGAGASAGGGKAEKAPVSEFVYGKKDSANKILRVEIMGPILTHKPETASFFGSTATVTYGYEVKEQLLDAAKDDSVKAVFLQVTTPGGSIVGSEAIADGIEAVKAAHKPVIAYVDSLAASGGVWSTAPADKIFADFGTLYGHIGVIVGQFTQYKGVKAVEGGIFGGGVETTDGVDQYYISAGIGKTFWNPYRPLPDNIRSAFQATADEFYQKFVDHVTKYRPIDRNRLVNEWGAAIWGNDLAQKYGYIDGTKTYQQALQYTAEQIGAKGDDWELVTPPEIKKTPLEELLGVFSPNVSPQASTARETAFICSELEGRPIAMDAQAYARTCGL